jgi:hypothetical protein
MKSQSDREKERETIYVKKKLSMVRKTASLGMKMCLGQICMSSFMNIPIVKNERSL